MLPVITGIQIRAALGALNWTVGKLEKKSGVSYGTIQTLKKEDGIKGNASHDTLKDVHGAIAEGLAEKGIELDERHIFRAKEGEE